MLLDPNVAGRIPETEYTGEEIEAERTNPPRPRSRTGVKIFVDTRDPNWREDVTEAYVAAAEAMGIDMDDPDRKTVVIKEGL